MTCSRSRRLSDHWPTSHVTQQLGCGMDGQALMVEVEAHWFLRNWTALLLGALCISRIFKLTILWNDLTVKLVFGIKNLRISVHSVKTELGSINPWKYHFQSDSLVLLIVDYTTCWRPFSEDPDHHAPEKLSRKDPEDWEQLSLLPWKRRLII